MGRVSVCTCSGRGAVDVKLDTQCSGLCEDVADLRFELRVKGRAAEAELVLVVSSMLNSGSCKKTDGFPMGQAQKTRLRKPRASCFTCLDALLGRIGSLYCETLVCLRGGGVVRGGRGGGGGGGGSKGAGEEDEILP